MIETIAIRLAVAIIFFIIGIYMFICAVKVKGFIYSNESLHHTKYYDKYISFVRGSCFVVPVMFTVNLICNSLSFAAQYALSSDKGFEEAVFAEMLKRAEGWYSVSTVTLILSITLVIAVILYAVYYTGKYAPIARSESLSGSHPAFKKNKK